MPLLHSRHKPHLLALFGILAAGIPSAAHSQAAPPSPATAARLRRLLPFPEEALRQTMDLSIGLESSPEQGAEFFRLSSGYNIAHIVAVRQALTGGTADAARYSTLGRLYRQVGLPNKSQAAFKQSEALYQAVLQKRPADGPSLAGYALTLEAAGQAAFAEAYLRKAVQTAPKSADVWMALGFVLSAQASPKTEPASYKMHQAAAAFNQAVLLAPKNAAVWTARGDFRSWLLPQFQGKPPTIAGVGDYERAARLSPNDPNAQIVVPEREGMLFEMMHHLYTSPEAAKMQPLEYDRQAKKAIQRVTAIAQSRYGQQSASAYKARAWLQFEFFYDPEGAQKSLRLALRQNPRQRDAADYQIHIAAVTGSYAQMALFCRREMRLHPELRLRVLLAEADYYVAQQKPRYWQEARTQMELAHDAALLDDALRLGLAVLLLKSGQGADQSRAAVLLGEIALSSPNRSKAQQAEYDLTRGVAAALAGRQKEARARLALALQDDPHNHPASSALTLL